MPEVTPQTEDRRIRLADGRAIGFAEFGEAEGFPCLYFHGWPGSRLEAGLFEEAAREQGLRLIAVDRPGVGRSEFQTKRRPVDWPHDIETLASALGLSRFAVLGYSAGAPYALACASRFPDRLVSTTLIAGLGPLDAAEACRSLPPWMRFVFALCHRAHGLAVPLFGLFAQRLRPSPERLFPRWFLESLAPSDRAVLGGAEVRGLFHASVMEAFRAGPRGVAWEGALLARPWGFSVDAIRCPVMLWHGEADHEVPVTMARRLAARLSTVRTWFLPDEGHFSLPVRHQHAILGEVKRSIG